MILNMGPQHPPPTVFCGLSLSWTVNISFEPSLFLYLHRMHEKWPRLRPGSSSFPIWAVLITCIRWHGPCLCGRGGKLAGIEVPERAEYIRVILTELNRISSHLLWWGAYLLDLGAFTPIMYGFDDREILMDIMQKVTGARLTYSNFRFGGVVHDLDDGFADKCTEFIKRLRDRLPMYKDLVTDNIILRNALKKSVTWMRTCVIATARPVL